MITTNAQNVVRKGNVFIEQPNRKTDSVYVDKKGEKYPIYESSNKKLYIIKTAKTTGKKYRKYVSLEPENKKKK